MQGSSIKQAAIIFREELLPYSETFIPAQVNSLLNYEPYYVGTKIVNAKIVENAKLILPFEGKSQLYSRIFKFTGYIWQTWLNKIQQLDAKFIHAHFGLDGVLALPLARKLRLPLIVTFHGHDITVAERGEPGPGWWTHQLYIRRRKLLFAEANLCIAVSNFIRSKLIEKGCPENKIIVHYIGVDKDKFTPDPTVLRKSVVLFVARLVERKGCEYLIQAMAQVQAAMSEVELVVIGDGPLRPSLEEMARRMLRRYQFLGAQPPEIVRTWMNQAKVFSVPSITAKSGDMEGFGMVFAEAQAMGLPVVSCFCGGIPEAVADGETGFLATESDSKSLAACILRLLEDEELWQRFSQKGQERVRNIFNLKEQTRALESIYEHMLGKAAIGKSLGGN